MPLYGRADLVALFFFIAQAAKVARFSMLCQGFPHVFIPIWYYYFYYFIQIRVRSSVYLGFFHALFAPQPTRSNCLGDVNGSAPLPPDFWQSVLRIQAKSPEAPLRDVALFYGLYGGNSAIPRVSLRRDLCAAWECSVNLIRCPTIGLLAGLEMGTFRDLRWSSPEIWYVSPASRQLWSLWSD